MERKLAAIFSTDVQGYSRLMGDDEEATIRTLKTYREVITNLIEHHHGRVVDSPGDNLLAEFASAVDAVKSAVAIQHELKTRNAELDDHRKMEFRIGLNVGDVVTDEGRLYGDGVNIAARIESLAEGGGISLSGTVYDQVKNKLPLTYADQGTHQVKNIAEPVRAYKVELEPDGTAPADSLTPALRRALGEKGRRRRWAMPAVAGVSFLVVVAIVTIRYGSFLFPGPSSTQRPLSTQDSELGTDAAPAALPLPDKPSIAVLPFTNMSGHPEQEYFSDGLTEDLITDLSKFSGLFVIARNSTFTYKGQTVNVAQVGRELGVRYVLEGSVRKAGEQVRITAQLVEAATGKHVWAENYDRPLRDIFALQDDIVQQIGAVLRVKVLEAEQARVRRIPTENLTAYDTWLRGREYLRRFTKEGNAQARQLFERTIKLDPQYASAYAWLGWTYWMEWVWWKNQDPPLLERAGELAQQALALDDSLLDAHMLLGFFYLRQKQPEQALAEGKQALALDPNYADAYASLAEILNFAGQPEEAIGLTQQAMRLNPQYSANYPFQLGIAYFNTGQYAEAIAAFKDALRRNPNFLNAYTSLSWSYLHQWSGQRSEAPRTLERAEEAAQHAVALSDSTFYIHGLLSWVYLLQKGMRRPWWRPSEPWP